MLIGRSAPRYERMAVMYPQSTALQSHMSEYFIVVVQLCHQVFKTLRRSIIGQFISFQMDADLQKYEARLDQWAHLINEEVALLSIDEHSTRLRTLQKHIESQINRKSVTDHYKILDACSTYIYSTTWKELCKVGYTNQFSNQPAYEAWISSPVASTLLCQGKLGSGKSVWLANMVSRLSIDVQSSQSPVLYFFCKHDIHESLKARTVFCSLVRQLLQSIPDLKSVETIAENKNKDISPEDLLKILTRLLPCQLRPIIILDGIDEMEAKEIQSLVETLAIFQGDFNIKICISIRLEAGVAMHHRLQQLLAASVITIPEDNPDIGEYIYSELTNCLESGKLTIGDPNLIVEIQAALTRGSQGMFLWVYLQISSICMAQTDQALRDALQDLPKDLPETYRRILTGSASVQTGQDYRFRVFQLVAAAVRPLTTDELKEALSVVPGNIIWDSALQINNVYSVLESCGSLVTIDEEAITVRLVHHSLKQFLLDRWEYSDGDLSLQRADKMTAGVVITYLNYNIFERQITISSFKPVSGRDITSKIVQSLGSPDSVRKIALKLLKSGTTNTTYDAHKALLAVSKTSAQKPHVQYHFYKYAIEHWIEHSRYVSPQDMILCKLLVRLITTHNAYSPLMMWAACHGHDSVVKILLRRFPQPRTSEISERQRTHRKAIAEAMKGNHSAVVKALIEPKTNPDMNSTATVFHLILHEAANAR